MPRARSASAPPAATGHSGSGQVRIIGGRWKRTRLAVPHAPGLRPTPDRVRETLFNWLGQDLTGLYCLDAFAGSGALGLEAASRYAACVRLVEHDRRLCAQLQAHADSLLARSPDAGTIVIARGDGVHALQLPPAPGHPGWDVVFVDPPYAAGLEPAALRNAHQGLAPDGLLYLESSQCWQADALQALGWQRLHYLKAGAVHAHLLQRTPSP